MANASAARKQDNTLDKVWGEWEYKTVILSYMDEAGGVSYQKADRSRFFIRSCVLVREEVLRSVQADVEWALSGFPLVGGERLPFHAAYIYHGRMAKARKWEAIPEDDRQGFLYEMADVLKEH